MFLAYVAQVRVPVLSPGDIVMRDNPGSDKVAGVRKAIAAAAAAPCFLPAYSPGFDPIDPSAGSGGLRQLSAGFSTNLRLLEPEAGFAQKQVAQNGPPNRRCSVGWPRKRSRRLPSKRRLQSFPNCRIWLLLIGIRSSTDVRDAVVRTGRIIVTWAENVFQKNPLAFARADSGHRRQRRSFRRGPLAAPASARSQVLAPCPDDWDCR